MDTNQVIHPPSDNFTHLYWCNRIKHLDYDDTFTKPILTTQNMQWDDSASN